MAKWSPSVSSDSSGILRKKQPEKHEELLVFGYSCKLFRDDEKALYIDQGKHLIPWMGDEKLKIDRYDCRGALSELGSCEASREGYDATRWLGLSESERRIEQLCDEERYHSLYTNEEEEELYKEEERKRLQQTGNEFQYSYDGAEAKTEGPEPNEVLPGAEEEPFVAPPSLDVPADIVTPKTMKENARIEKTALFVHRQGPQMEILIKAKQSDNPQFGFLNQDNPLYKYYRHVLSAIKSGRYEVQSETENERKKEESSEQESNEDAYLHPSLLAAPGQSAQPQQRPPLPPPPPYRPSADCTYSQLVNRIQGATQQQRRKDEETKAKCDDDNDEERRRQQIEYEQQQQQQYYRYYYAMQQQYYEYYKQMLQYQTGTELSVENFQAYLLNSLKEQNLDPNLQNQYLSLYSQYLQQQPNAYAQIVSNVGGASDNSQSDISKVPIIYSQTSSQPVVESTSTPKSDAGDSKRTLLSLAENYGSDSDGSEEEEEKGEERTVVREPPGETRMVIDKMASYVGKNGADFEAIVRSKGDPRFEFLNEKHEYHAYYKGKIEEFVGGEQRKEGDANVEMNGTAAKSKSKKVIAPVSFSIKKPKDDVPKEIKSALPLEESSEEESEDKNVTTEASTTPPIVKSPVVVMQTVEESNGTLDEDPILEMIDLTDDSEDRKEIRRVEDRIKDKLAAAAREKLASATRDKALQMERRKKAAAFLKLKSGEAEPKVQTSSPRKTEEAPKKRRKSREDSDVEEGEIKKHKKKKKTHKRKHSRSKSRKKSKKRKREEKSASRSS